MAAIGFALICSGCDRTPADGGRTGDQMESGQSNKAESSDTVKRFLGLVSRNQVEIRRSFREIESNWQPHYAAMLLEATRVSRNQDVFRQAIWLLEKKTGKKVGTRIPDWEKWIWNQGGDIHPEYAVLKSELYSRVDPRFAEYFQQTDHALIRLDEIVWGGVRRDGIPPLKNPKMISAKQATYLGDSDVVFGVVLNGDARCYPKRVLAWHEMFKDTIGGESVCGVY